MWKKSEDSKSVETPAEESKAAVAAEHSEAAVIGRGIIIKGDVTGNQNLLVQGQLDGTITLPDNEVIIGQDGRVNATINARTISIEGAVEGDIKGVEQIIVKSTGDVTGNISAPRVGLEDGALFKGRIDMEPKSRASGERPSLSGDEPKPQAKDRDQDKESEKDGGKGGSQQAIPGTRSV